MANTISTANFIAVPTEINAMDGLQLTTCTLVQDALTVDQFGNGDTRHFLSGTSGTCKKLLSGRFQIGPGRLESPGKVNFKVNSSYPSRWWKSGRKVFAENRWTVSSICVYSFLRLGWCCVTSSVKAWVTVEYAFRVCRLLLCQLVLSSVYHN